ncbi:MAG: TRAP transporter small permease [Paracoccaceae bacterium]|nr:TRAP transporter small permease [Paracoccaceae bacterium]
MPRVLIVTVRALALAGGLALLALVAMVGVSALGAAGLKLGLPTAPLKASYELIEASLPMVIFAFMPWVQLQNAHARVDLLADRFPPGLRRTLAVIWALLAAGLMAVIAWRLGLGMGAKMRSGTTTFLLGWPLWWFYGACLPGAWATAGVALWQAGQAAFARREGLA